MLPLKVGMSKKFYMCQTDWDFEIGEAPDLEGKMPLYSSVEELKEQRTCWDECGIVEVEITKTKVVLPANFPKLK